MITLTKDFIKNSLPKRNIASNKGDFGKVLCITGSEKYIGAGILSALSALRVGAGYSFLCSEKNVIDCYKNISPDLIYKSHNNFDILTTTEIIGDVIPSAVLVGCGIDKNANTQKFIYTMIEIFKMTDVPVVIDADGLNCLAEIGPISLGKNFILTPHPKELSRLLNITVQEVQNNRLESVCKAKNLYNATVILKGYETLVCALDNNIYRNTTGNNALAKAGTGDVLAGMIAGFLAQKSEITNASCCAVYLHGLAADLYKNKFSEYSMLPSELLEFIPLALAETLS